MPVYSIMRRPHKCTIREMCYSTQLFKSGQPPPANTFFEKNTPTLEPVKDRVLGQVLESLDRQTFNKLIQSIEDFGFQILDGATEYQQPEK